MRDCSTSPWRGMCGKERIGDAKILTSALNTPEHLKYARSTHVSQDGTVRNAQFFIAAFFFPVSSSFSFLPLPFQASAGYPIICL